jgi:hypothetical protein
MVTRADKDGPEKGGLDISTDPLMDDLERVFRSHNPDRQDAMMRHLRSDDSEPAGDSEGLDNGKEEG